MIGLEIKEHQERKSLESKLSDFTAKKLTPATADYKLFRKYIAHFDPNSPVIRFLRNHDLANAFHKSEIKALWDYSDEWSGPSIEFVDHRLEMARIDFDNAIRAFVKDLVLDTFPHKVRDGFFTMDFEEVHKRPELQETRKRLNELSSKAVSAFDTFYRTGKWLFKDQDLEA